MLSGSKKTLKRVPAFRKRRLLGESLEPRWLLAGPYAPAAGNLGTTAVDYRDAGIEGWASEVVQYLPGTNVSAAFQNTAQAIGSAGSSVTATVSLGRGGSITLGFEHPIRDGLGFDFAVFENAVSDTFLELAKVEVSSDGVNFFPFASDSLTSAPVDAFGALDTTQVDGLAGKYRAGFGTPFDLASLRGISPDLNVNRITQVRLIDVIGDGSALDSQGDVIYDPYPTVDSAGFDLDGVAVMNSLDQGESVVSFEDVGASLSPESAFSGPISGGTQSTGELGEFITQGVFQSDSLQFNNSHSDFFEYGYTTWNQWAYSNVTNQVTAGFQNQFGVITGGGAHGSDTFAVAFVDQGGSSAKPTIFKATDDSRRFSSLLVTNTTYAALSMKHGDSFAKEFGGVSGTDEDYFLLHITGRDSQGQELATIEVYLADYRFADDSQDYILEDWIQVDLQAVEDADTLEFALSSSDVGDFGMNTPAYFALDQIVLTSPALYLDIDPLVLSESPDAEAAIGRVSRLYDDSTGNLSVTLGSSLPSSLTLPSAVTIPDGTEFVDFSLSAVDDALVQGDRSVSVTVDAVDYHSDVQVVEVTDDDSLALQLTGSASTVIEGGTISASVSRNVEDLSSTLTVQLSADVLSALDYPAEVVIPVGQSSVSFLIEATEDSLDREDQVVTVTSSSQGYQSSNLQIAWEDNDQAALSVVSSQVAYQESAAAPTVGFELLGRRMEATSFLNGSNQAGDFQTKDFTFNNDYDPQWGSWSGWAISNTRDSVTPGYGNQYSAYPGVGAASSETYAIASAFGSTSLPSIQRDPIQTAGFQSVAITNTTYAVLSMLQGDAFAKKFGGVTGDDPDWMLLTIEGLDQQSQVIGAIDFYLADYRFVDNQNDYVVDQWTEVSLSPISDAVELRFSLSSSDVGEFGMNTPAYFALDQLTATSQQPGPSIVVSRNTFEITDEISVQLQSSDESEVVVAPQVVIPSGIRSVEVPFSVLHDELVDGDREVTMTAGAAGFSEGTLPLTVTDSDVLQLTLTVSPVEVGEAGGVINLLAHRNVEDVSTGLTTSLTATPVNQVEGAPSLEFPVNSRVVTTQWNAIDNSLADGDREVSIQAAAANYLEDLESTLILDDEKVVRITSGTSRLREQDARPATSFEDLGTMLPEEAYINGSKRSGEFVSGQVKLNNLYNDTFDSWSGWAFSNTTDSETPGYLNQYSSVVGTGAIGSETYAVANAYPGSLVPEISIADEASNLTFQSLMVSNTAYAYHSMSEGDAFAKKFGGPSGTDPDYFLLTIQGLDQAGSTVGQIEFPLADFRYEDPTDDYLLADWTLVDLTSLVGARSLQFSLESSDVGGFGMNTPAYFALDQLVLNDPAFSPAEFTVTRVNDDLSQPLTVELTNPDASELYIPKQVVMPAGVESIVVPVVPVNDAVVDGETSVQIEASTVGYVSTTADFVVEDDDQLELTLSLWQARSGYTEGDLVEVLVHRNDAILNEEINVDFSQVNESVDLPITSSIPLGSTSQLFNLTLKQNQTLEGNRTSDLTVTAPLYLSSNVEFTVLDDEVASILVEETNGSTSVGELTDTDTLLVHLGAIPLSDVFVELDLGLAAGQAVVDSSELHFTPSNWNKAQAIMIQGVPDFLVENNLVYTTTLRLDSDRSATLFSGAAPVDVGIEVIDQNPTNLLLSVEGNFLHLVDRDRSIVIEEEGRLDGISVVANDLSQTIEQAEILAEVGPIEISLLGGNDAAVLNSVNEGESKVVSIDGGDGFDVLELRVIGSLDFVDFLTGRATAFESYVVGGGEVLIRSNGIDAFATADQWLHLEVNSGHQLLFSADATLDSPILHDGVFAQVVQLGDVQVSVKTDLHWRNIVSRHDVDASNTVTAIDALQVINEIVRREGAELPSITDLADFSGHYVDVSGDGLVTALDAIQVINHLVSQSNAVGGEWIVSQFNASVDGLQPGMSTKSMLDFKFGQSISMDEQLKDRPSKLLSFAERHDQAVVGFLDEMADGSADFQAVQEEADHSTQLTLQ